MSRLQWVGTGVAVVLGLALAILLYSR
ncbi:MAG: hypothetical protein JWP68_1895, partial [Modestobacter sp.]|nr:hypothetical protein [Modestobacter sp.]